MKRMFLMFLVAAGWGTPLAQVAVRDLAITVGGPEASPVRDECADQDFD
jgi:hypothetical protein